MEGMIVLCTLSLFVCKKLIEVMRMSKMLDQARKYEKEEEKKIKKENRPEYHFSNPVGWMNDPNGFSDYKGEHHLFFQYYPYATNWELMYWGHAKSNDFINWEYLPAALAPDCTYDHAGVFSGSAMQDGQKQVLVYTGVDCQKLENGETKILQTQCIAIGDGTDYTKYSQNPVVTASMLPEGCSLEDFRDPKIWKENDRYYMVAGSRNREGVGQAVLFLADKLEEWKFAGVLDHSGKGCSKMWECPDFFSLSEKQVLLISPQEMEAEGLEFHNGSNTVFLIGTYDKETMQFTRECAQCVDYGLDFYAPQTMQTEDHRRILIAWMQSWENPVYPDTQQWSGMMTVPRELFMHDGRICQLPVRELDRYHMNEVAYRDICIEKSVQLDGISGRTVDLKLDLKGNQYTKFQIKLASDGRRYSEIVYDRDKDTITFDRTYSGLRKDTLCTRRMKVSNRDGEVKLRILIDRYSVEIFVNDGEQVMTALIYTPLNASEIHFESDGKTVVDIQKYDIEVL